MKVISRQLQKNIIPTSGGLDLISNAIATCTVLNPQKLLVSRFKSRGNQNVSSSLVRDLIAKRAIAKRRLETMPSTGKEQLGCAGV